MTNRLINEQSLYLLQHAHNPVDWYPWGDEAFQKAKLENKPVLVSIGYAACHWCHVMEHESFENSDVAQYMNDNFVCIKVDREERPDVDHLYMDALQALTGSGGWPLNVFVTPERLPFYGGTYFPPNAAYQRISWTEVLKRIVSWWIERNDEVIAQAEQLSAHLKNASELSLDLHPQSTTKQKDICISMREQLMKQADKKLGGFGSAPKFPSSFCLIYLLEHAQFFDDEIARNQALLSIDKMLSGGIYDQLGGGFARYATDNSWLVPHFEKMLYDNALMILTLCDAYQITKRLFYKQAIVETIAFVMRELKSDIGLFYSALDADSEGEEGKFYTWTWDEWQEQVQDELVTQYFGVSEFGNWEGTNILHASTSLEAFSKEKGIPVEQLESRISAVKKHLIEVRNKRIRPLTDDKCILSWNALMSLALTRASVVLDNANYLQEAIKHLDCTFSLFASSQDLKRTFKSNTARMDACLDDYAFLIQAAIQLASLSNREDFLVKASSLCETAITLFGNQQEGFFYFSRVDTNHLPIRKIELIDGATPSGNSIMAQNLLLLGMCMGRTDWWERGNALIHTMANAASHYPTSFGYWSVLFQRVAKGMKTVVVAGSTASEVLKKLQTLFLPQAYFLISSKEISELEILKGKKVSNQTHIFVCTQQACMPPVQSIEECVSLLLG
ncbi:MAG: thioredoxin domain-containing protein [Bacteroidetes bacterium]|nr:thioredoxin domain-containing protein [Bacteroidota bacterium]